MWVWKRVWPQKELKWCGLWWQLLWQILRASLGSNFEKFAKMWISDENDIFANFSKLLPSEALKICHSDCHHRPHYLSPSCGYTSFHTDIIWLFDDFLQVFRTYFSNENRARTHTYWWHTYKYLFYVYQVWHLESWWSPHFKGLYKCQILAFSVYFGNYWKLKLWNFAQCFKTWIQLYLQSLVAQFFPTSPNQIYYVTKLEALY